jgi:hypothetical protein
VGKTNDLPAEGVGALIKALNCLAAIKKYINEWDAVKQDIRSLPYFASLL